MRQRERRERGEGKTSRRHFVESNTVLQRSAIYGTTVKLEGKSSSRTEEIKEKMT